MEPEIIDLTDSSPSPPNFVDLTEDHVEDANAAPTPSAENGMKKSRKRKKKKVRTAENGQASTVTAASTENMPNNSSAEAGAASTSTSRRDDTSLYFIDVIPVPLPPIAQAQPETQESQPDTLLLPAHVAVFGNDSIPIVPLTQKELGEEDYIEYLAYDDYKASSWTVSAPPTLTPIQDTPRYFEDQSKEEAKHNKVVCKNCGAEGEHKTSACPIIVVCLVSFVSTLRYSLIFSSA
jgi:protein AIR1/2